MRSTITVGFVLLALADSVLAGSWPLSGSLGAHDPTIIKEGNTWWCFATGFGVPIKSSSDGLRWSQSGRLFDSELPWWRTYAPAMGNVDVWAPDLHRFGGRTWCFYSVSEFGRNNSAIGLKSCTSIAAGDWRDDGLVISSSSGSQNYNAIDPNLTIDASGNPWLAFGSWFDGIHVVQLDPGTMKPTGTIYSIAQRSNGIEGSNIVYANGYYYLFVSIDICCQGVNSTYKIAYGRSRSITGPYVDKNGTLMLNGGCTLLEVGGDRWKGPGGEDVYQNGSAWVIARHAYDAFNNGTPTLLINDLYWDAASWPTYTGSGAPVVVYDSVNPAVDAGSSITFNVTSTDSPPLAYQWLKNGLGIAGATNASLSVTNVQPGDAGVYSAIVTGAATNLSDPAAIGIATLGKVLGSAEEVGPNILHPNGNIYDQVLLQGTAATITADPGQITRVSYIDRTDDIVQVEFSGAGTLSITLEDSSGPAPPIEYNQASISYMRGTARIVIAGANDTTNVSVFSVGRLTAVNQALFRTDVTYDGWADIASIVILSANGQFGGVRTANTHYSAARGMTGIYAPRVEFTGPVYVGGITATDVAAGPVLLLGSADGDTLVTCGDLRQPNGQPVAVSGLTQLKFVAGTNSHGVPAPALANQARLQQDGADVTDQIVVNPTP
jgi:arabinan endo-1,5-alpha-L-arabinosidase